jgi:hypothetical protein
MRKLMRELMHVAHELGPPAPRRYRGLHAAVFLTTRPPRGRRVVRNTFATDQQRGTGGLVAEMIGVGLGTEGLVDGNELGRFRRPADEGQGGLGRVSAGWATVGSWSRRSGTTATREGERPGGMPGRTEVTASLPPGISLALDKDHAASAWWPRRRMASVNAGAISRSRSIVITSGTVPC